MTYLQVSLQHRFLVTQTGNDPGSSHHQRSTISTAEVAFHRPTIASISLQKFKQITRQLIPRPVRWVTNGTMSAKNLLQQFRSLSLVRI